MGSLVQVTEEVGSPRARKMLVSSFLQHSSKMIVRHVVEDSRSHLQPKPLVTAAICTTLTFSTPLPTWEVEACRYA